MHLLELGSFIGSMSKIIDFVHHCPENRIHLLNSTKTKPPHHEWSDTAKFGTLQYCITLLQSSLREPFNIYMLPINGDSIDFLKNSIHFNVLGGILR